MFYVLIFHFVDIIKVDFIFTELNYNQIYIVEFRCLCNNYIYYKHNILLLSFLEYGQ